MVLTLTLDTKNDFRDLGMGVRAQHEEGEEAEAGHQETVLIWRL